MTCGIAHIRSLPEFADCALSASSFEERTGSSGGSAEHCNRPKIDDALFQQGLNGRMSIRATNSWPTGAHPPSESHRIWPSFSVWTGFPFSLIVRHWRQGNCTTARDCRPVSFPWNPQELVAFGAQRSAGRNNSVSCQFFPAACTSVARTKLAIPALKPTTRPGLRAAAPSKSKNQSERSSISHPFPDWLWSLFSRVSAAAEQHIRCSPGFGPRFRMTLTPVECRPKGAEKCP